MSQKKNKRPETKKKKNKLGKVKQLILDCNIRKVRSGMRIVPLSQNKKEIMAVHALFERFSAEEIYNCFSEIERQNLLKNAAGLTLARPVSQIFHSVTPKASFEKNVSWCLALITHHKVTLKDFISKETLLTSAILHQDVKLAESIIDGVNQDCGESLWAMKLRLALEVSEKKNSSDNAYMASTIGSVSENQYLSFVIDKCKSFCDENTFILFGADEEKDVRRADNEYFRNSILYHIFQFSHHKEYDYGKILSLEKNSSIIDIFQFLRMYCESSILDIDEESSEIANKIAYVLSESLELEFANNLLISRGLANVDGIHLNKDMFLMHSDYEQGLYSKVVERAGSVGLSKLPFPLFELVARANVRVGKVFETNLASDVLEKVQSILLKNDNCQKSMQDLSYLSYVYRSLAWFQDLSTFTNRESGFSSEEKVLKFNKILTLRNYCYSPEFSYIFGGGYLEHLKSTLPDMWSVNLHYELSLERGSKIKALSTPPELLSHYKVLEKIKLKKYIEVIENLYMTINGEGDELIRLESLRHIVDCLINTGKMDEAVSFFVDQSVFQPNYVTVFDIESVIAAVIYNYKKTTKIEYPIALSIYSKSVGSKYDSEIRYSFELFLTKNNMMKPQELFNKEQIYGLEKLHYFLKWVCTPENMSLHFAFSGAADISKSREAICKYLIKKGDKSSSLSHEIIELSKLEAEKIVSVNVDKSKIHVDTNVFIGRDSEKFRVLFDRYLELRKKNHSKFRDEIIFDRICTETKNSDNVKKTGVSVIEELSTRHYPGIPMNQKNSLFLGISKLFREEFAYGEKGLNVHLSTRVRHGYLPTAIEKPFKDEGILFKNKNNGNEIFTKSKWCSSRITFSEEQADLVFEILVDFSKNLGKHIDLINNQWLQILTLDSSVSQIKNIDEETIGKINFSVSAVECFFVEKRLPISPTYDDLVRVMVGWLWEKADYSLNKISDLIKYQSNSHLLSLTENLLRRLVNEVDPCTAQDELCNSVSRAKNKINSQVAIVCSWFDRADPSGADGEYDFRTILDMAGRPLSLDFSLESEVEWMVSIAWVNHLTNLFHILFDNAVSKSKLSQGELDISVYLSKTGDTIKIDVENKCSYNQHDIDNLSFYRDAYGDESLINDAIQQEGGTGFFKIWKILERDMEVNSKIDMGYKDNDMFFVAITLIDLSGCHIK